jgi:very-short-patch-repair endonuclease
VRGKGVKRKNIEKCRNLRRNQTETEKKLWAILRSRKVGGIKFRRQFSIDNYVLDFYCPEYRLGIEADGGGHYEDRRKRRDKLRTRELSKSGVEILRFSDLDILNNIEGVWEVIRQTIENRRNNSTSP